MLFCEPLFLFGFLPVVLAIYLAVPTTRLKNAVLTAASLIFYATGEWRFLGWLIVSVAMNYWIAIGIDKTRGQPWCRPLLAIGIVSDLALLLVFKYAGFLIENLNWLLHRVHAPPVPDPGLALPLGISFFTFHKISYKVDVYRGTAGARRQPLDLALYILLFPQLIAGPIVRYHEIATELVERRLSRHGFAEGIARFVRGLGKKMIVANSAAKIADSVFAIPYIHLTSGLAWLGAACYAIQIYFDFSGYSDMAIGLAKMFGFSFPENFNYPYISTSITEFWRRWHMSLSRWFRDYVYLPMGGNRHGPARTYFNLTTVFLLCGLWHGASWTFVLWGIFHGALLVLEKVGLTNLLERAPRPVRHVYTLVLVLIGWVLFRADTLERARAMVEAMFGLGVGSGVQYTVARYLEPQVIVALLVGVVGCLPIRPAIQRIGERIQSRSARPAQWSASTLWALAKTLCLCAIYGYSIMLIAAKTYNPFIYFRF